MATLAAWRFSSTQGAEHARHASHELTGESIVAVDDVATVTWEFEQRKPRFQPSAGPATLGGSFWDLQFGTIFLVPLLGAALGTATGATWGSLSAVGIDDTFINKVRDKVTPGSSALFVLPPGPVPDEMHDALAELRPVELVFTELSHDQEVALREVFAEG